MFAKLLTRGNHTRRFFILDAGIEGWEVREEEDDRVLRRVLYTDWHRVERAAAVFGLETRALQQQGWMEA
jgi:hypothetical protein